MTTYIALRRGINVGKAKRIAMADLRALLEGLGHTDVATLLNSGNVVFRSGKKIPAKIAAEISAAIAAQEEGLAKLAEQSAGRRVGDLALDGEDRAPAFAAPLEYVDPYI